MKSNHLLLTRLGQRERMLQALRLSSKERLTKNEMDCAELILKAKTAKEIAKDLGLSYRTIEDRISALKIKFNAKNKADLIVKLLAQSRL